MPPVPAPPVQVHNLIQPAIVVKDEEPPTQDAEMVEGAATKKKDEEPEDDDEVDIDALIDRFRNQEETNIEYI